MVLEAGKSKSTRQLLVRAFLLLLDTAKAAHGGQSWLSPQVSSCVYNATSRIQPHGFTESKRPHLQMIRTCEFGY